MQFRENKFFFITFQIKLCSMFYMAEVMERFVMKRKYNEYHKFQDKIKHVGPFQCSYTNNRKLIIDLDFIQTNIS